MAEWTKGTFRNSMSWGYKSDLLVLQKLIVISRGIFIGLGISVVYWGRLWLLGDSICWHVH